MSLKIKVVSNSSNVQVRCEELQHGDVWRSEEYGQNDYFMKMVPICSGEGDFECYDLCLQSGELVSPECEHSIVELLSKNATMLINWE